MDGGAPTFAQMQDQARKARDEHGGWFWGTVIMSVVVVILLIYIWWTKDTMTPSNLHTGGNLPLWHKGSEPTDAHTAHQKSSHNVAVGMQSFGDWSTAPVTAAGKGQDITAAQREAVQSAYLGTAVGPVSPCSTPSAAAAEELQMARALGTVTV